MLLTIIVALLLGTTTPIVNNDIPIVNHVVNKADESEEPVPTIEERIRLEANKHGVNPDLALAISFCESGRKQFNSGGSVLRGKQNSQDVGLFQINEHYHLADSQKMGLDIHTIEGNIGYAMYLLKTQGSKPWGWSAHCHSPE